MIFLRHYFVDMTSLTVTAMVRYRVVMMRIFLHSNRVNGKQERGRGYVRMPATPATMKMIAYKI